MLYRVPPPEFFESPASWVSRVAIGQGVPLVDLLQYLELPQRQDLDLLFKSGKRIKRVAKTCGLDPELFWPMKHMFSGLWRFDRKGSFLLREGELARYRYCPGCFKRQRSPHLPLHWRFNAYRWCAEHQELLRDRCPKCSALVILPANLVYAAEMDGRPQLDCCMVCSEKLSNKVQTGGRFAGTRHFLTPWEHRLLRNGTAVLAALLFREVRVGTSDHVRPLKHLRKLERAGHIPHQKFRYENLDAPYPKYRNPFTDRLSSVGRPPRDRPEPGWHGLFDGFHS